MAEKLLAITTEYVRTFVALWQTTMGWPDSVIEQLASLGLVRSDILHVLKDGEVICCEKETADGAIMVVEGRTCDDVGVRVKFWSDVNIPLIRLQSIELA